MLADMKQSCQKYLRPSSAISQDGTSPQNVTSLWRHECPRASLWRQFLVGKDLNVLRRTGLMTQLPQPVNGTLLTAPRVQRLRRLPFPCIPFKTRED